MGHAYASGKGVPQSDSIAVKFFEIAAEGGDPQAMFTLSTMLHSGKGCDKNLTRAFDLAVTASELGHPMAMYNVGFYYLSGSGVAKDYQKAAEWFQRCVSVTDLIQPRVNLAKLYMSGLGVEKNFEKARSLVIDHVDTNAECKQIIQDIDSKDLSL